MRRSALPTALLLCLLTGPASAQGLIDEHTERLLVEAVTAAVELDLYNARCRSEVSGRRTENLNKTLASRFRLTVIRVQDDMFPERSYRRVQERLQQDFLDRLREVGGCREAKQAGMQQELNDRYQRLMQEIRALP